MRALKFIVKGQAISKDNKCDFTHIAANTKNYLRAQFQLDEEWRGCRIVASFYRLASEYSSYVTNNACMIPDNALTWDYFDVELTGMKKDGTIIKTNRVRVEQERYI